jgi:hypothetical protein
MGGLDVLHEALTVTLAPAGDLTRHLPRAVETSPRSGPRVSFRTAWGDPQRCEIGCYRPFALHAFQEGTIRAQFAEAAPTAATLRVTRR